MLKNYKDVKNSRLNIKESDYKFFMDQTELSRADVEQIFKVFDEKGGVLNRIQFKKAFEILSKNWLGNYKNSSEISDLIFRAFDKDHDSVLELHEFMQGCATLFLSKGDPRSKLEYIFNFYDANNDGYLTLREIKEGYKALFSMLGAENVDNLCKQMAESALTDMGSVQSKISKERFIDILMQDEKIADKMNMLF